jgi:hypothetical protein
MTKLTNISVPLNKTYFNTFINNMISIHFFNDNSINTEYLKNLLFPPEHSDYDFSNLVKFIKEIFEENIKSNKDFNILKEELSQKVIYNYILKI